MSGRADFSQKSFGKTTQNAAPTLDLAVTRRNLWFDVI
jgi:hypothetical protein